MFGTCPHSSLHGILLRVSWRSLSCWERETLGALGGQRGLTSPRGQGGLSGGAGTQRWWNEGSRERSGKEARSHISVLFSVPSPKLGDAGDTEVTRDLRTGLRQQARVLGDRAGTGKLREAGKGFPEKQRIPELRPPEGEAGRPMCPEAWAGV